jgi:hypothetical protein
MRIEKVDIEINNPDVAQLSVGRRRPRLRAAGTPLSALPGTSAITAAIASAYEQMVRVHTCERKAIRDVVPNVSTLSRAVVHVAGARQANDTPHRGIERHGVGCSVELARRD